MFSFYRLHFTTFLVLICLDTFLDNTLGMHNPGSSSTTSRGEKTATPIVAGVGSTCHLKCRLTKGSDDVQWYIHGKLLNHTQDSSSKFSFKRRHKREILTISKVSRQDAGLYSCMVKNRTKVWRISVKNDKTRGRRSKHSTREYDGCPKGPELRNKDYQHCTPGLDFKNCSSVAGAPVDFKVGQFIYKNRLIIQPGWAMPRLGRYDLWGYEVELIGLRGATSQYQCVQINQKTHTYWSFKNVAYDAEYIIKARSLPSNVFLKRRIRIKEKCQFKEFKNESAVCCTLLDINSTLESNEGKIHLTWKVQCPNKELSLKRFTIYVIHRQLIDGCSIKQDTPDQEPISGTFNYTIRLREECRRFNYSIRVYGRDKNNKTTERGVWVLVSFPENTGINRTLHQPKPTQNQLPTPKDDRTTVIVVSAIGVLFGVALVVFLFRICKLRRPKEVTLLPYQPEAPGDDIERSKPKNKKKRVFIIHARCCNDCEQVLHCLGQLLNATNALIVRIDLWKTQEIAENPMRWYETEIKDADSVIILTSNEMNRLYDSDNVSKDTDNLLSIRSQLNLVIGAEKENPSNKKFITAFFSYNCQSSEVPLFLKSRLAHNLPKDLDSLLCYLLEVEPIRPDLNRPVAIFKSANLDLRREELHTAVRIAEESHPKTVEIDQNTVMITEREREAVTVQSKKYRFFKCI